MQFLADSFLSPAQSGRIIGLKTLPLEDTPAFPFITGLFLEQFLPPKMGCIFRKTLLGHVFIFLHVPVGFSR